MKLCCSTVCVHKLSQKVVRFAKNVIRSCLFPPSNRDWSELPLELLELILQRLSLVDMVRAELVCSSWHAAVKSYISSPVTYKPLVPQSPWLQIPSSAQEKDDGIFYSVSEQNIYIIKNMFQGVGNGCNVQVVGSSYGWLVIRDSHLVESGVTIFLFNPITRVRILLPPLKFHPKLISSCYLSSDPSCNTTFYVVLRNDPQEDHIARTAFCKHSDDDATWTCLDEGFGSTFIHKNFLCGLSLGWGSTLLLRVFDLETNTPIHMDLQPPQRKYRRSLYGKPHLMESQGEIWFVIGSWIPGLTHTYCYEVYRLNFGGGSNKVECVKVECLQDRCVLLGKDMFTTHTAISLSTLDLPGLEPNSIHSIRCVVEQPPPFPGDTCYWKVSAYNLENKGGFKSVYRPRKYTPRKYGDLPWNWIVPNPCML